ncbi:2-succinyl-5-enolpyruvyl-6-hydroxy-3-cyclohexene-1-carboxylic-acid synthase [Vibrio sp. S12_S33]|uniref:2-succinyl-5-enolpyruvyl-6-hydroxy-3- cyclohexene-1-carboxylic-acid synthase n=1 Tax=Vibrio sp. S12_S33 TaxID=2720223 RepID=UPI00177DF924|nr:2-succinyl-5-enolpyruvyl-6-hydroxy-3-cyclohexene-1-carboxylic-acid synthase [Vibrio sp. S12_S33]MBD1564020.1 2-succinyl-5-enolpyruvyl-6-hydroxy-3-cyclohexene-1-carboxylic-acid synthase [Vibrio sp. S12_S33]
MKQDQAVLNRIWSQTLLEELTRLDVEEVCIAPGSRSTPLTLEADANQKLTLHTHFDERGLGFLALGLAKASQKPVAVIVTSGTAVANLLPAIAESKLTGEKLVVLSADRPLELVGCGANQAINQVDIYSSHVTQTLNLPSPNTAVPLTWLLTSLDEMMANQARQGGTVHINCPFPEPLYSQGDKTQFAGYLASIDSWQLSSQPYSSSFGQWCTESMDCGELFNKKGLVIIGSLNLANAKKAKQFANKLGWPVLCDPQSGVNSDWTHFDLWLQNSIAKEQLSECEVIVQFGARLVSKRLNQWLSEQVTQRAAQYIYVSSQAERNNPSHLPQWHFVADIEQWVETHISKWTALGATQAGWADQLKSKASELEQLAQLHLCGDESLSEIAVALDLAERSQNADLFLGNSLIVRLVDMFATLDNRHVYSNRGASGIDGLVATMAGVQRINQQPMLMLIGDTALLYDLNSLALVTHTCAPLVIVVTNNDGGAIFDLLPVPEAQKSALYQMPHGYQFEFAAKQFGLSYVRPQTLSAYQSAVSEHLQQGQGTLIVEVITPPEQASTQLRQFTQQIDAS